MQWVRKTFSCRSCGWRGEERVTPGTAVINCPACRFDAEAQPPAPETRRG